MDVAVKRYLMIGLLAAVTGAGMTSRGVAAEPDGARKTTKTFAPIYPDSARRLQLSGTVRLSAVVAADGRVTDTEVIGGHPILVAAAADAVKRWKYEKAARASHELVVFAFAPQ
jgi:TonB family protein